MVMQVPNARDLSLIQEIMKNIIENQLSYAPKDCLKFANVISSQLSNRVQGDP